MIYKWIYEYINDMKCSDQYINERIILNFSVLVLY